MVRHKKEKKKETRKENKKDRKKIWYFTENVFKNMLCSYSMMID